MHSLPRLFATLLLLGTALHLGWLQAAIGFATERLGGPGAAVDPLPPVDALGLLERLGDVVVGLPEPWRSLAMLTGSVVGLVVLTAIINGVVRTVTRLTGWLRDVSA